MTTPALDALRALLPLLARDEDRAVTGIFGGDTIDAIDAARAAIEAVEFTPLGVRGIKALQSARAALEGDEMTIDTNELRRLAQAATHPVTKGRWMRLFGERTVYDRMEDGCRGIPIVATDHLPAPKEAAYLDFIAAANPATISEMLDRLEAAEKERDWHAERCQDAMTECDSLRAAVRHEADCVEACKSEIERLRAKIEVMEKQEPVAWTTEFALELGSSALGFDACRGNLWGEKGVPLYTNPTSTRGEEE